MLNEALALGTTGPPKVLSNPRKVRAFGMRDGRDICLTRLPHAMKILECFCRFENCMKCLEVNKWLLLLFEDQNVLIA